MIRLTQDIGNVFYVMLRSFQWGGGRSQELMEIVDRHWSQENREKETPDNVIFHQMFSSTFGLPNDPDFNEITSIVGKALMDNQDFSDGALIGELIQVLQSPNARNVLSGNMLNRLRSALLIPEEMIAVRRSLFQREMSCGGCGHQFGSGEMGTLQTNTANGMSSAVWICSRCQVPTSIACTSRTCHGATRISEKLMVALQGKSTQRCEQCRERGEVVPEAPRDGPVDGPVTTRLNQDLTFAQASAARGLRPRPRPVVRTTPPSVYAIEPHTVSWGDLPERSFDENE